MDHIHDFLTELKPYDLPIGDRIRLGSNGDGGYVLLNRGLQDVEVLYSYGVGANSDFEFMFCEKHNAIARLYDHTVDTMPLKKDFLHFKKQGVGVKKSGSVNTIENHINENGDGNKRLILKIDVEGAEWDTLLHTPNATLESFEQIAIEIHNLHSFCPDYNGINLAKSILGQKTQVIKKLNNFFYLNHVHANNYQPLFYVNRFKLPNAMELTFVNKKYSKSAEYSKTIFPTEFDRANDPKRADINLHFWPFHPGTINYLLSIVTQVGWRNGWRQVLSVIYHLFESKWKSAIIRMKLRRPTSYS